MVYDVADRYPALGHRAFESDAFARKDINPEDYSHYPTSQGDESDVARWLWKAAKLREWKEHCERLRRYDNCVEVAWKLGYSFFWSFHV